MIADKQFKNGIYVSITLYAPERNEYWVNVRIGNDYYTARRNSEEEAGQLYLRTCSVLEEIEK